mgnify:CR=1 FL=1
MISGSPGGGKTKIIELLKERGYIVYEEYSRSLIEELKSDKIINPFLKKPEEFSQRLFKERSEQYLDSINITKSKGNLVFFDRGVHDIYAYLLAIGKANETWKKKIIDFKYDFIFLVKPWREIYKNDNQRIEPFEVAKNYYTFIKKTYTITNKVIEIPKRSVDERVNFVESYLSING